MKNSGLTDEQIIEFLKQIEAEVAVEHSSNELHGITADPLSQRG